MVSAPPAVAVGGIAVRVPAVEVNPAKRGDPGAVRV